MPREAVLATPSDGETAAKASPRRPILVLGATGYIGARLVQRLAAAGNLVRAAGRSLEKLRSRPFAALPGVELAVADALDPHAIAAACGGCRAAYYLVHSMDVEHGRFAATDREAAGHFARAAADAGLAQIVYLGGLGEDDGALSEHLRSRAEVGDILREGAVPVTWLRAAMVVGSGSGSFEILRYLVERLPVMITPRWLDTEVQPVAIGNVLDCLAGVLDRPEAVGQTFDVGGSEVITYRNLMSLYADEAGLPRRFILPVPILSPRLSSYWIDIVTPIPASLAHPLAEGLRNRVVCRDTRIAALVGARLIDCREAIRAAIRSTMLPCDPPGLPLPEADPWPGDPAWAGGTLFVDRHAVTVAASLEAAWRPVARIGGDAGWYHADALWRLRGAIDRLLGGVGMRRGRRDPESLAPGDALDFWRVEAFEPGRRLLLRADLVIPGRATFEIILSDVGGGATEIALETRFAPRGAFGILVWRLVDPFHHLVFPGLLREIARRSGGAILSGPAEVVKARRG
jgi:uncharacterized protein YbjT (DUF2867 family)